MRPAGAVTNAGSNPNHGAMLNHINNAICLLIAAAVFAMIGADSGAHHKPTHSGTQQVVRK
jgi:hypothetical protein